MVVIGVDPDSGAHGVAVFKKGELTELMTLETLQVAQLARDRGAVCSIEHVSANGFVYSRNNHASKAAQSKIAMQIGRCQQAQIELCRILEAFQVPYQLIRPQQGNWAKNKPEFERVTGWSGRSNEDTRSAAFFGFLLARK